ncbi:hypothetical protein ACFYTS_06430 [Nocardia sp. NPDC004151]|uniref:helix-turn-helix domain-containing protein n=1 Tax=Nocardia sp. NPDC004151 TaxID=3364304 RepID=UPI003688E06F
MDNALARDLWRVLEPLHAVTYCAADCIAANKAVGLRGFWMGYFAARSAPFGTAGPAPTPSP